LPGFFLDHPSIAMSEVDGGAGRGRPWHRRRTKESPVTVAEVQAALAETAAEMLGVEGFQAMIAALPLHPQEEAMLEGAIPCDVPTELLGTIEDDIRLASAVADRRLFRLNHRFVGGG
jgi:hypothetical protein